LGAFQGLDHKELVTNSHYRVLFIKGLFKSVTRDQLMEVCAKYGTVESLTIKTRIQDGHVVSQGIAIVQYSKKEEATLAMKKLHFHNELGSLLNIDYYLSKESRTIQVETNQAQKLEKFFNEQASTLSEIIKLSQMARPKAGDRRKRRGQAKPNQRGRSQEKANQPRSSSHHNSKQRSTSMKNDQTDKTKRSRSFAHSKQVYRVKQQSNPSENSGPGSGAASGPISGSGSQKTAKPQQVKRETNQRPQRQRPSNNNQKPAQPRPTPMPKPPAPVMAQPKMDKKEAQNYIMQQMMGANNLVKTQNSVLVKIPLDKLNGLGSDGEKKQFLGNYLYHFVTQHIKG
jgi:hypothetical protein